MRLLSLSSFFVLGLLWQEARPPRETTGCESVSDKPREQNGDS
jgi:hypothetical protein